MEMRGRVVDECALMNPTNGGSSDTDVHEPTDTPTGPSLSDDAITATLVGARPSTARKRAGDERSFAPV